MSPKIGTMLDVNEPMRAASQSLEPMSSAVRQSAVQLLNFAGQVHTSFRAIETMRSAIEESAGQLLEFASQVRASYRAIESMRSAVQESAVQLSNFANQTRALFGASASVRSAAKQSIFQLPVFASPVRATSNPSTADDCDLAAEVQNCAIELLALLKEDEPDLEISNRETFAWNLARAEFDFLIDMLRLTGRITDLYSHTSSASTDRFTEFRQRD